MRTKSSVTRRTALKLGAAATALPLVHIRTAGAAGKLSLALWDHWVPTGNAAMKKLVDAWAEKNKVDVQLDFLTAIGNKINITMAAEAQAKTGHDVYAFDSWTVQQYGDSLDSDGRRDEVADREIRQPGTRLRISWCRQWALAGGSSGLGFRAADAVRPHQHDEEVCQYRRAGLVSGA